MSRSGKDTINYDLHRFDRRVVTPSDQRKQPPPDGQKKKKAREQNVRETSVTQPVPQFQIGRPLYFDAEPEARIIQKSVNSILQDDLAATSPNIDDIASSDSDSDFATDDDDLDDAVYRQWPPESLQVATLGAHTDTKSSHASSSVSPRHGRGSRHVRVQSSDPEEGWKLTKAAPGGPYSIDLIPSFGAHIAYHLWTVGMDYRLLADFQIHPRHDHLELLQDYAWNLPGARVFVEDSGLSHLPYTMSAHYDYALMAAFIERWQPDTNTFHMPFGEMTITLHDVLHILRIPIKGKPFISRSAPEVHHGMAARILDVTTDEVKKWFLYGGGFHVVNLLKHIGDGKVPTAASEAQIYLFCLLGSTLLPDTTGSCAKIGILESLTDVRKIREYAWGAATLAHMYRELGKASRAKSKNFCGCMTLLQSWIYEYFPSLRRVDCPAPRDVGAPLVGRWDDVRLGPHSGPDGQQRLYMLRDQLDRLTYTDVQWLPYGIHPFSDDGTWSLYLGGIHAFDYIEPHDPTRVLRQYGYRQTLKVDRIPYKSATRPEDPKHYAVEYVVADDYKKEGLFTAMYIYSTPSILDAEDENVDPGVMEWYLSRTHPYILPANFVDLAGGALSETPTEYIVRRFMAGIGPLFEPDNVEDFQTRAPQLFEIIQGLRGLWAEYMRREPL